MPPRGRENVFEENERQRRTIHFLKKENRELHQDIVSFNRMIESLKQEIDKLKQKLEQEGLSCQAALLTQ
jgi:prefoldin subunit 5